ncbi:MAG: site-2 protease family protein, partial [Elusimicrobia bacterium]|nr:site-2 protease family protein [Elusimicrobiota bacterium]
LSINDVTIENWQQMQDEIASSYGKAIHVHVQRQGQEEQVFTINPQMREAKDIFGRTRKVAQIGVQPETEDLKDRLVIRRYNILGAVVHASGELLTITTRTLAALWEIVTGQRSAKEGVTGLIGIFFIVRHAITVGFSFVLYIMAVISASLAIFNLLPMIPLDGGHLALNFLEKMRRRTLSQRTEDLVTRFGLVLIIALAVFVFYVDFERIGLIDRIVGLFRS